MKRYAEMWGDETKGEGDGLKPHPNGQWVNRVDLIAAGCLVPVPVGEPCLWDQLSECSKFIHDGGLFVCNGGSFILLSGAQLPKHMTCDTIVQPVRLVPLAELEADHG